MPSIVNIHSTTTMYSINTANSDVASILDSEVQATTVNQLIVHDSKKSYWTK